MLFFYSEQFANGSLDADINASPLRNKIRHIAIHEDLWEMMRILEHNEFHEIKSLDDLQSVTLVSDDLMPVIETPDRNMSKAEIYWQTWKETTMQQPTPSWVQSQCSKLEQASKKHINEHWGDRGIRFFCCNDFY